MEGASPLKSGFFRGVFPFVSATDWMLILRPETGGDIPGSGVPSAADWCD